MTIIRLPKVKQRIGHSSGTSVYNDVRAGLLTRPVKIGSRSVGWPDYEVEAVCEARIAGADKDTIRSLVERLHAKRAEKLALLLAA